MTRRDDYRAALAPLGSAERTSYLRTHSGLPGPRGNLELIDAAADLGDRAFFESLIETDEEYLVCCGAVGLGVDAGADPGVERRLRTLAADARWRVREGVAMGLQRLGDVDPVRLRKIADSWGADADALVQRAAIAAICEPRLLREAPGAAHAVDLCERVTESLAARPADKRRDDGVRALRKALGYCWSVAVAADPAAGLARFRDLAASVDIDIDTHADAGGSPGSAKGGDPDVRWVVRENLKKARLTRLLKGT